MSEQNRYQISFNYKSSETEEWTGWRGSGWLETADTWQDAIRNMLLDEGYAEVGAYQVVSETPSEDGKSGILEIQFNPPFAVAVAAEKIKATLIED